jgi:hypothetical protein
VYINGLEVPVMGADIEFSVWSFPTLTLSMVPHPLLRRIGAEDRLQVAFFYLDTHWEPDSPQFRLLAEFEVIGWGYTNSTQGRTIQLKCISHLHIFEQLKFYYISSLDDIVTALSPAQQQDAQSQQHVKLHYPASLFLEGLTTPPSVMAADTSAESTVDVDNFIKRPIDFILNIFRAHLWPVTDNPEEERAVVADEDKLPLSAASVSGKNFFARWFKMTGFHRRWAALPIFEDGVGETGCFPLVKAVQDTTTLPALQQQVGLSVGNGGSAWSLLQQVFGYMYMEVGVIPAPPAARTERKTGTIVSRNASETQNTELSVPTYFVKPMCTFALPPACNVVFPIMIQNFSTQENYLVQPTRLYLGEQFITDIISTPQAGSVRNFVQELMVTGYPPPVETRMQNLLSASTETSRANFLLFPEEFYKGPVSKRLNAPPWMYMLSQQEKAIATKVTETEQKIAQQYGEEAAAPLGALFTRYAKYEFYRSRYAERNGGLNLAWNPYIVPGFPTAVLDREKDGFDVMAYANTVRHSLNATSAGPTMSTQVNLTFVRTMAEFLGLVGEAAFDAAGFEEEVQEPGAADDFYAVPEPVELPDISPPEVIDQVRDIFQYKQQAHNLYHRLLYRDDAMSRAAVFDWEEVLDVRNQHGDILDLETETWKLDPYITLTPKASHEELFRNYDAAMRYAARPACTLQEYIETWHGRPLEELLAERIVLGEYESFYSPTSDPGKQRGALFWGRIYKLLQGPGSTPAVSVSNVGSGPDFAGAGHGQNVFVDRSTGQAETREDWDTILEEYRKIVRSEEGRIAPLT